MNSDPNYETAYYFRAITKYYLKDYENGLADCNKALTLKTYYETYFWRGLHFLNLKRYQESITDYDLSLIHI